MTDKEMAEEQIKKWDSFLYPQLYPVAVVKGFIRKAFLAGLKTGRPVWHDLRKDHTDVPKESEFLKNEPDNHRYEWYIVAHVGKPFRALYSFAKKKWFIDYEEMMVGNYFEPIAWCEIPKYEEEEKYE